MSPASVGQRCKSRGDSLSPQEFQDLVWAHYRENRRTFPWRGIDDPYLVLLSEVMLQQTQTDRVVPFFETWRDRWPTVVSLAEAAPDEVIRAWSGLGYYRRAKNLHRAARIIATEWGGRIPSAEDELQTLPGIGHYTAAAVCAFAFNRRTVFIETNIRTVFIATYFPGTAEVHDRDILPLIEATLPAAGYREWYYALMDYGAHLKRQRAVSNTRSATYARQSPFKGSRRELRAAALKTIANGPLSQDALATSLAPLMSERNFSKLDLTNALNALLQDELIEHQESPKSDRATTYVIKGGYSM